MRNCEVYAYIESLYEALYSGLPIEDALDDTKNVVMNFEEEVRKQMKAEEKQKSGFDSTPFFSKLADSDDEELINFCERMNEVHPSLGKFMQYLMEEDDPTFFIAYKDEPELMGKSSDEWAYKTSALIFNHFLSISRGDSDDK